MLREIFVSRRTYKKSKENSIMRSFLVCITAQKLLGQNVKKGRDGHGVWLAWENSKFHCFGGNILSENLLGRPRERWI